jgi:excisionase family DNA binding protein
MDSLIVSVSEAAELLGVSTDLVYELTARGDIPFLKVGRRKLIPRRAVEMMVDAAVDGFDPNPGTAPFRPRPWAS